MIIFRFTHRHVTIHVHGHWKGRKCTHVNFVFTTSITSIALSFTLILSLFNFINVYANIVKFFFWYSLNDNGCWLCWEDRGERHTRRLSWCEGLKLKKSYLSCLGFLIGTYLCIITCVYEKWPHQKKKKRKGDKISNGWDNKMGRNKKILVYLFIYIILYFTYIKAFSLLIYIIFFHFLFHQFSFFFFLFLDFFSLYFKFRCKRFLNSSHKYIYCRKKWFSTNHFEMCVCVCVFVTRGTRYTH